MPDDNKVTPDNDLTPETPPRGDDRDGDQPSYEELQAQLLDAQKHISKLNHEAAQNRVAADKERAQRLAEQGNFKTLADERAQRIGELEAYEERAKALEDSIRKTNEARIASIPDDMRGLVPTDYPPEKLQTWLDQNQQIFNRPKAPSLGAGLSGGNGASEIELTPTQKQVADAMGMTYEQYAQRMKDVGLT